MDSSIDVVEGRVQIQIVHGSILETDAQVIVNAANSFGIMGGGVAGVIKRAAGPEVEEQARQQAPIPVGHAVLTSGGRTGFKGIIHAPTMPRPAMRIEPDNVAKATRAALELAERQGFVSVAIPGMGTGVGGVAPDEAASRMIGEIQTFRAQHLQSVVLVDIDPDMIKAWKAALNQAPPHA